jgi:diguanylate cyclase
LATPLRAGLARNGRIHALSRVGSMQGTTREHSYTVALADVALQKIRAFELPADPPSYEVWYAYASGTQPSINAMIDGIITSKGTLSAADIDCVHSCYLSGLSQFARAEGIGARLADELDQAVAVIEASIDASEIRERRYSEAAVALDRSKDQDAARRIVEEIVESVWELARDNQALRLSLNASRDQLLRAQADLASIRNESLTDPLTRIANRKHFDHALGQALSTGRIFSLLLIDVDHFKRINDRHGHLVGDHVLRLLAATVKEAVRGKDLVARFGGDEFAVILPDTPLQDAVSAAENIRKAVSARELRRRSSAENLGRATLSIGAAEIRAPEAPEAVIARADKCLYAAKGRGRNCTVDERDPDAHFVFAEAPAWAREPAAIPA